MEPVEVEPPEDVNPLELVPPLPTYSEDGVDLTLIRWMLSLTPLERVRTAERYANSLRRLQNAQRRR